MNIEGPVIKFRQIARKTVSAIPLDLPVTWQLWAAKGTPIRRAILIDPDLQFLYTPVAKAANSTIRRILWRHLGVEVRESAAMSVLHAGSGPMLSITDLSWRHGKRKYILNDANVFRFTFVRNPYDRIISSYRQKFFQPSSSRESPASYLKNIGWIGDEPPSLAEFISKIARQSDVEMNIHWLPQHRSILWGKIDYTFVGKVESFVEDMTHVLRSIGSPELKFNDLRVNTTVGSCQLDDASAELIYRRYRRDFEIFGYAEDSYRLNNAAG